MAATHTHTTTEKLLEAVFYVWSVPKLYNESQVPKPILGSAYHCAERELVFSAKVRHFNHMLYERYVQLTKAEHIHERQTRHLVREDVT
jgi:hypothetical protein